MTKNSSVVLISSIGGYEPTDIIGVYNVSKTALLGMTQTLSNTLSKNGIRVNCVAPGVIPTKFSAALVENDTIKNIQLQRIPMKRFGTPQEIASVVAFLVSDDASYITGETIVVAGGARSRL